MFDCARLAWAGVLTALMATTLAGAQQAASGRNIDAVFPLPRLTSPIRTVGAANGRNPLSLVVPGHRVLGADGSPTGFRGGIERKRWLLQHEGALRAPDVLQLPLRLPP